MNALIIGGNSGIGRSIAQSLLEQKHQVYTASRNPEDNKLAGVNAISYDATQTDQSWVEALPDHIDAFVYCPGSINLKPFRSLKTEDFSNDFNINVLGAIQSLHAVQKKLKKSNHPSVLLFSTVAVQQGMPFHASVAASKGAIEGLTRSLAAEWAPKIRVNAIAPSLIDTPLAENLLANDKKREQAAQRHPMKKIGTPEDIAQLANFLIQPQSSWISGQIIGVDGGLSTLRT